MCHRVKPTAVNCAVVSHSLLHRLLLRRLLLRRRTVFLPLVPPSELRVFSPSLLASDSKIILTRYGSVPLRSFLVFASDLRSVLMPLFFSFFGEKSTVLASQCLLFVDAFFVACKWRSSLVQVKSFQTGFCSLLVSTGI